MEIRYLLQDDMMKSMSALNERGTTIVMVTHSQRYADYAKRIIRLFDGAIVTEAAGEKVNA